MPNWKPSEVVFVLIALTAGVGLIFGKLSADNFMLLAAMTFGFYFGKPSNPADPLAGK